jgi:tRNA pseudouridine55 synthase
LNDALDGLLLIDKPTGPTSHDVVQRIRRASGLRRVGHAGTLDPAARGLLPLVLGRATRLVRFLPASPKTYLGTLRLGRATATDDETGEVVAEHAGPLPPARQVAEAARAFLGRQLQVPPAYSARRVAGQRLYRLARQGVVTEAPPTEIEVMRFDLRATADPAVYEFTAEVSGGTYIRGLARDLGRNLGCGGTLASLVRTRIGPLDIGQARALPHPWVEDTLIGLDQMPLTPPPVRLDTLESTLRFRLGAAVLPADSPPAADLLRVLAPDGTLLGIAEPRAGELHPKVVLRPVRPEERDDG